MENNIEGFKTHGSCCSLDMGRGCEFCGCKEGETGASVCEGCFKLHVTDWLEDYPDNLPNDIVEVRFKNTRRSYYRNVNDLQLKKGDIVAVEASPGHDIGIVSLTGDMVARQMRRVGFNPLNGEFKKVYRKAKQYDIEKWQEAMAMEHETMIRSRRIAAEMNLNMKIGDVEYQGDRIKAIFYYIADERVDFRELIKVFAEEFHIRVEMKQIGARQEAGRIGGIGSCGRELCCASWISSFMSVTTNAARTQEISLNPQKLAGQCSKLKCCLIYEYDDYMDARKDFPRVHGPLYMMEGEYHWVKNDILARTMSFGTAPGSMAGLVTISVDRVREIMKMNARGVKPDVMETARPHSVKESEPGFVNVIGEESITRFDREKKRKKKVHRGGQDGSGGDNGNENSTGTRVQGERRGKPGHGAKGQGSHDGGESKGDNRRRNSERWQGGEGGHNRNYGDRKPRPDGNEAGKPAGRPKQDVGKAGKPKPNGNVAGKSAGQHGNRRKDKPEGGGNS